MTPYRQKKTPTCCWSPLLGLLLLAAILVMPNGVLAAAAQIAPRAEHSLLLDGQVVGDRLVVVGERGHILISDDAGRSWQQRPVPTDVTLTSVHFHNNQIGWAAGHDAVILRTDDGGLSWRQLYADAEDQRPILDLWFRDALFGYAIGAYGLFLETSDGGDHWQAYDFAPALLRNEEQTPADPWAEAGESWGIDFHFNQIAKDHYGRLFIAAEAGNLYRSDDGCRSWVSLPSPYDGSFYGLLPLNDNTLLLYGLRGHLFSSEDAGLTFEEIETGSQATLNDAIHLQDGRVVAVGLAGTLLMSADHGQSFTLFNQPERTGIARVLETADHALILIGEGGVKRIELPTAAAEVRR